MKLIIEIPKEKYDWIINRLTLDRNFRECKIIPLPKGHGDLIDANVLCEQYDKTNGDLYQALDLTHVIIEADKGE